MSAFKTFTNVQFANAVVLIKALKELGFEPEYGQGLHLYGYRGDRREETAQIVVRRQQIGASSNDLGFAWAGASFVPIISEFDAKGKLDAEWLDSLQATYAKHAVLQYLEQRGAEIMDVARNEAGAIAIRAKLEV